MKKLGEILAVLAAAILLSGVLLSGCVADAAWDVPVVSMDRLSVSADAFSPVYADWSRLTPYVPAKARYTSFTPFAGKEDLTARNDYGPLLPYVGAEDTVEGYVLDALPLWGLTTLDGQLVTDPVYAHICVQGPFLLMAKGHVEDPRRTEWHNLPEGEFRYTIAAPDGSWVRQAGACSELYQLDRNHLMLSGNDGSLRVLSSSGDWTAQFTRDDLAPFLGDDYNWNWDVGPMPWFLGGSLVAVWEYDAAAPDGSRYPCYLDTMSGDILTELPEGTDLTFDSLLEDTPEFPGYGYVEKLTDLVNGRTYYTGWKRDSDVPEEDLLDEAGNVVKEGCFLPSSLQWQPILADGMLGVIEHGTFTYTSLTTGKVVFSYPLRTNSD